MYHGERLNSITHVIGAVLALVGFGALLTISISQHNLLMIISFVIFGLTLILMYTMSSLYHSFPPSPLKNLFRKLDHVSIYLLIAGTYTPYMLVSVNGTNGIVMLVLIWSLAIAGLLLDLLSKKRIEWLQITIYLVMGWICTLNYSELEAALNKYGVLWLTMGGIAYTAGIVFYVLDDVKRVPHSHGIWHLFVLTGSVCHFVSIAAYVR